MTYLDTIPLVYVMSPYSDPLQRVRASRFRTVWYYTSHLTSRFPEAMFYSPIAYFHPIAVEVVLPTDAKFWWEHSKCMIVRSQLGIILRDKGWEHSAGIAKERAFLNDLSIPIIEDDLNSEHEVVGQALQKLA